MEQVSVDAVAPRGLIRTGVFLAFLVLAAVPRGGFGQEGKLRLEIPEVIVVGKGPPLIRTQRPPRPITEKLPLAAVGALPAE